MSDIARSVTLDVCSHCGEIAGTGSHGHSDAPDWRWLRVEYVPVSQLAGAVEAETLERHRWALDAAVRFITENGGNPDVVKSLLVLAEWGQ